MKRIFITLSLLLSLVGFSNIVKAQEPTLEPLTDVRVVTIDLQNKAAFEKALKAHMQYRVNKGDPYTWNVYSQVVGSQMESYVLRACCTNWDKIADYVEWSKGARTSAHWGQNVTKYVVSVDRYLTRFDDKNSVWDTEKNFKYFGVNTMTPAPGEAFSIQSSIKAISDAAKEMKWPESWSWHTRIGGSPQIQLVVGYESYADMMPQDKSFYQQLSEQMNSKEDAQELLEEYGESFSASDYSIYVFRKSLSSPEKATTAK